MGTDVVFPIQDVLANDFPFFSDKTNLLQLVSTVWVAAVKGRTALHRCDVIFFWSTGIMDLCCFGLRIEYRTRTKWRQLFGMYHYF